MKRVRAWLDARRLRRRMAIVDVVDDNRQGVTTADLARLTGRKPGSLHPDLAWLERLAYIDSWWEGPRGSLPRRRIYGRCKP